MNTDRVGDTSYINQKVADLAAATGIVAFGASSAYGVVLKRPRAAARAIATKRSGAAQGAHVAKRLDTAKRSGGKRF
jgi:hypothetical protein